MEYPPQPNEAEPPEQQMASVSELHPTNPEEGRLGPAVTAFYEACAANKLYPTVGDSVKARLRPRIALEFVREVTTRSGIKQGRADIRPTFDQAEIKRNIDQLQGNYGATPPADAHARKIRALRISRQMERAGVFSNRLDARMPYVPEIDVAYRLYDEILEAGDTDAQDSIEILLAAYGMSVESRIRPLE